ncbi:MAG: cytochrome c biogenesis protein CcsA [Gemmatimonadaceae bacterium]|nr:cytochrome c biogenesis protein CcsA [Gemmatimonadaceae bacterium]
MSAPVIDTPRPPAGLPPSAAPVAHSRSGLRQFGLIALALLVVAQVAAIAMSRPDAAMGHTQKIMYVHVPTAWTAFLSFFLVFVYSVRYLWTRDARSDRLALGAAEVGTALTALTIVQGSIWGKPTWGVWWTWDPRLTTTAIMLLIYVGYLALRAFTDDHDRAARWAAAVGVLGFINVPIVYMSVRWWRTIHQVQSTSSSVDPSYRLGLLLNVIAMTLVVVYFILERAESARLEREVDAALERRMLGGSAAGA